jgi:hypothetical protein
VLLPSIANLKHLQLLDLSFCQLGVRTAADWNALASLTQLTYLRGIDAFIAPPPGVRLPCVKRLGIENAACWHEAGLYNFPRVAPGMAAMLQTMGIAVGGAAVEVWHLAATFPQLIDLCIAVDNPAQWLGVQPVVAEVTGLWSLVLHFRYRMSDVDAGEFERLGSQLPALRSLTLSYCGGPDGWRLPRMEQYSQIKDLSLQCDHQMVGRDDEIDGNDDDRYDARCVTALMAHLLLLQRVQNLFLHRLPGITPGVVLGLRTALPELQRIQFAHCEGLIEDADDDQEASWDGSQLQLARAALSDAAARGGKAPCEV